MKGERKHANLDSPIRNFLKENKHIKVYKKVVAWMCPQILTREIYLMIPLAIQVFVPFEAPI